MARYYAERLSADRLRQCYDLAPPRIRRYLYAEIAYVAERIRASDRVLELGCGYGRVIERLAGRAAAVVGIDNSLASLQLGWKLLGRLSNVTLIQMDAAALAFADRAFDVVVCIQNGLSAFNVDQRRLIGECIRVARPGGCVLLSSYAEDFWEHRLEWFRLQADAGLLGEIDLRATGNGVIVCKDGFRATTIGRDDFTALASGFGVDVRIEAVDGSSLFCELLV